MKGNYYWLSPDVTIVPLGDGNVLFKSDALAIKIESESVNLLLEKIFPLLTGEQSIDDIAKKLEVPKETLTKHLDALAEKGVLKLSNEPRRATSNFENFLFNTSLDPQASNSFLANIKIAIFGLEAEGALVAKSLLSFGIKNLVLADPFPAEEANGFLLDEYKKNDNKSSRQHIIKKSLDEYYPGSNIKIPVTEINKESVAGIIDISDIVICCFDKNFIAANYWINAACLEYNKPCIFSSIDGHTSVVGPLVIPGQTACFMCYKMRCISNAEDFEISMAVEKKLNSEKKPALTNKAFLHSIINFNCSLLSTEIIKYIFALGAPALASHVMEFNHLNMQMKNHYVMQMPECKACKKKVTRKHPSIEELKNDIYKSDISHYKEILVSNKTGVINKFGAFQKDISEPTVPYIMRADISNHRFLKKKDFTDNSCSGKGLTIEKATISALGEAAERYSGACYDKSEVIFAGYDELTGEKLNPEDLVLFAPDQYKDLPYKPYTHTSLLGWAQGYSLVKAKEIYVPAISVFMNYELQTSDEYICAITSNGLAAGSSLLNAITSAAMEIIERDAFVISWHNKFPCKKIDPLSIQGDQQLTDYINGYKRRGVELMLFELPTDFPCHVFMALGIQVNGDGPYAVAGLGADFDAATAAKSALLEVGQVRPALKKRLRMKGVQEKLEQLLKDPSLVEELDDHDLLFASKKSSPALDFLVSRNMESYNWNKKAIDSAEALELLLTHLKKINSDLIYYNLTPGDMEKLGVYTCRAIIPHLQPIHFGYKNIRLGGKRMFTQAQHLGFYNKEKTINEIDLFPHPLA